MASIKWNVPLTVQHIFAFISVHKSGVCLGICFELFYFNYVMFLRWPDPPFKKFFHFIEYDYLLICLLCHFLVLSHNFHPAVLLISVFLSVRLQN